MMYEGKKIKAVKYNLYQEYELVFANGGEYYSVSVDFDVILKTFTEEFIEKIHQNYTMAKSPYYGDQKVWHETEIEKDSLLKKNTNHK